ncbi:D-ribose pyranase [Pseudomonas taetrolens]|uniref:D-ribose pyranase n=1 Tax=Pseudomonas taetrolens TaxID=47884 RepID=A0A0J6JHQ1_PSETA|nr:D-ribose pyranase [Pseudomonas taetrolens]KMM83282.1 ribose pyranase [Pseudomonas taetrolens]SEC72905.1 D-ribose pyranase [Pseudomonas taetrolens]SQF87054.1 D-ribose pyranase [Pseudomonas taetrolens]VEH50249.1 D-ribose pyranase [Pseudomonas taetrolens]
MKKTPLLNIALSRLVASLGHGDVVVIADAGLPVPKGVELIDLALTQGIPDLASTLEVLLSEMQVQSHVLAHELLPLPCPALLSIDRHADAGNLGERSVMSHNAFKELCQQAKVIIRTGECKPYCNIALIAGVTF